MAEVRVSGLAAAVGTVHLAPPTMLPMRLEAGCWARTLAGGPQVVMLVNHRGMPLASTMTGTLELAETAEGLRFDAVLDDSEADAALLVRKMGRGLVGEASVRCVVAAAEWAPSDSPLARDGRVVSVTEMNLDRGDVTLCAFGANPDTVSAVESVAAGDDDDDDVERRRVAAARAAAEIELSAGLALAAAPAC